MNILGWGQGKRGWGGTKGMGNNFENFKEVEGSYLTLSELIGLSMHIFYNHKKTNGLQYAFVSQAGGGICRALT